MLLRGVVPLFHTVFFPNLIIGLRNCRYPLHEKKFPEDVDIQVICTLILQLFMNVLVVSKEEKGPSPKSLS